MAKRGLARQFTERERRAIAAFLRQRKETCQKALADAKLAAKSHPSQYTQGQVLYWKHCLGCCNWCLSNVTTKDRIKRNARQNV